MDLTWTDASSDETSFTIQRAAAGTGVWTTVGTVAADTTAFTDTGLQSGTAYDHRVRAEAPSGVSAWSNVTTATTPSAPPPPAAPSGLTAMASGVDRIDLSWTDNSTDEDGFVLERSPAGAGSWTVVADVQATSYADSGLSGGTAYDYRVRAYNGGGTSAWSDVATATTAACATLPAQTLISVADSFLDQDLSTENYGSDSAFFDIISYLNANGRSLLRFAAPTISGGCAVTSATLRTYAVNAVTGRTLEAHRVAAAWDEMAVSWSDQPATSGAAATTASAEGWLQWDVTAMVGPTGAGAPDGFLLRDAAEEASASTEQWLSPREGANPPQLVVRFD